PPGDRPGSGRRLGGSPGGERPRYGPGSRGTARAPGAGGRRPGPTRVQPRAPARPARTDGDRTHRRAAPGPEAHVIDRAWALAWVLARVLAPRRRGRVCYRPGPAGQPDAHGPPGCLVGAGAAADVGRRSPRLGSCGEHRPPRGTRPYRPPNNAVQGPA